MFDTTAKPAMTPASSNPIITLEYIFVVDGAARVRRCHENGIVVVFGWKIFLERNWYKFHVSPT